MTTLEKLVEKVKALEPAYQMEALHFVDFLSQKQSADDVDWSRASLGLALRGTENEDWPDYKDTDYLEKWR